MSPQKVPLTGPDSLGRYQISGVLGQGAMGKVYKAFDPLIERTVAVKTISLRCDPHEIEQYRERFYREAKAAGGLNHPNIVTIYDVVESDDVAYIAMELLDGLSLRQVMDAGSRLPVARAARLIAEAAEALAYAHDRGVIHRDIKPANIVLTRSGLTKITDFGIAQLPATSCTQPGLLIGSPRYMSPEQILGSVLDGRADVFALGAVLYELLTGDAPFQGKDLGELMYRILHDAPPAASTVDANIPVSLDIILERAMAKNSSDRFQSARDFARALRGFQATPVSQPVLQGKAANQAAGRPVFANALANKTSRRHRSLAFVAMGFAAGGVFASVAFNQFTPMPVEPIPTQMRWVGVNVLAAALSPFIAVIPTQQAHAEAPVFLQVHSEPVERKTQPSPAANQAEAQPSQAPVQTATASKTLKTKLPESQDSKSSEVDDRLKTLQIELTDLRTKFTDLHPDVVSKKRNIELLEEEKRRQEKS